MNQSDFVRKRSGEWQWMEKTLIASKKVFLSRASGFPAAYRRIVRDLNTAKAEDFDPYLVERLDQLVVEGHGRLYSNRRLKLKPVLNFISSGFPGALRREWRLLSVFTLVFFLMTFLSGLLVHNSPWLYIDWFSPENASNVAEMYNPDSSHFLTPRDVSGDADMFGFYIYNNISISFQVFAGGILAGFGSLMMLAYNAVFIGATGGYLTNLGYSSTFYTFVCGHGTVEMLAIVFSGAAGWKMGWAFLMPSGRRTRRENLRATAKQVLPLVYGAIFFLILAAGIEAFWSSRPLSAAVKYSFGGAIAIMVILYIWFAGRDRRAR